MSGTSGAVVLEVGDFSCLQDFVNGLDDALGTFGNGFIIAVFLVNLYGAFGKFLLQVVQDIGDGIHIRSNPDPIPPIPVLQSFQLPSVYLYGVKGGRLGRGIEQNFVVVFQGIGLNLNIDLLGSGQRDGLVHVKCQSGCENVQCVRVHESGDASRIGPIGNPSLDHDLFPVARFRFIAP